MGNDEEKRSLRNLLTDSIQEFGFYVAVITIFVIAFGVDRHLY